MPNFASIGRVDLVKTSPTFTFRISFVQEKCPKQSVDGLLGHPVHCGRREGIENSSNVTPPLTAKLHYQFWSATKKYISRFFSNQSKVSISRCC